MSEYTDTLERTAGIILVQLVKYIDMLSGELSWPDANDGDKLIDAGHEVTNAIAAEVDTSPYTNTLDGALKCMAESDSADLEIVLTGELGDHLSWTTAACMFAREAMDTALRAAVESAQESIGAVWAVVLSDTCVSMEYHENGDNDTPTSSRYWLSYRMQEVECPKCMGGIGGTSITPALLAALRARCPCCMGAGVVSGEAFTVMRWKAPNCVLTHILGDKVDGSVDEPDNAYGQMQTALGEPIEVCDYDPEHDTESSWRWKHGIDQTCDVVTVLAYAELTDDERAEYELLNAARIAGVL